MGISALALRIRYPEPLDLSSSLDLPPVAVSAMGKYGRQIVWAPKNGKQYAWMVQEMFIKYMWRWFGLEPAEAKRFWQWLKKARWVKRALIRDPTEVIIKVPVASLFAK